MRRFGLWRVAHRGGGVRGGGASVAAAAAAAVRVTFSGCGGRHTGEDEAAVSNWLRGYNEPL